MHERRLAATSSNRAILTPEKKLHRFLLDTPVLRKFGRRVIENSIMRTEDNLRIAIRPARHERRMAEEILSGELFEFHHKILRGEVIFDVGAHIGCFTLKAGRMTGPEGRVFAIEPASDSFLMLQQNISLNGLDNCIPLRCAVGSKEGVKKLRVYNNSASNSFFERDSSYRLQWLEEVRVRKLDDLTSDLGISKLDFLKVNVEGSELSVLEGAPILLREFRPAVVVESHQFGPGVQTLSKTMNSFGYKLIESKGDLCYFLHTET